MAKKIGLGMAAAVIVISVTVFAADRLYFIGLQKDIRTIIQGILSPGQISTLIDFRRKQVERFEAKEGEPPDLFQTWKKLDLTDEQQKQLLKIAGGLADEVHPYLMAAIETAGELTRKVLEGDSLDREINPLSARLGSELGEIFWNLARAHSGAKAVLTAKQIEIMEQNRSEHDLRIKSLIRDLPGMAEDLAALWTALQLMPNQADALETVHRLIMRYMQNERVKQHTEMRADMANILTADQLALADGFYERQIGDAAVLLQMGEERERFLEALGLTGEQKIKLVRMALDRRARIVSSVQDVLNAVGRLREQVHARIPDRSALMAAAAGLGSVIGQAAGVRAGLLADVKEVLTTEQTDLVRGHINSHFDQHLERARMMPAKVHDLIDFLNELGLTPGQKDQVVTLIAERHKAQRARHEGMKRLF